MSSSQPLSLWSSLPFELVEEILHRTPIISLVRFKSVCKQWYALFNDKRFIYKHFDLSHEQFTRVYDKSVQCFNMEANAPLCVPAPDELHNYTLIRAMHCDGLLLCECTERDTYGIIIKLAVCNPFLSQLKWIEPSNSYKYYDLYAFGYDNVSRGNYKILRIDTDLEEDIEGKSFEIEIYEFKSKLWRSVDAPLESCAFWWKPVSVNGSIYWIAKKEMVNSKIEKLIQSFDFSTETFKDVCCLPKGTDCVEWQHNNTFSFSAFGGDKLSLLHQQHKHLKIDVWITNKLTDGDVSWNKYFSVTRPDIPILFSDYISTFPTYSFLKTKKIMLWYKEVDAKEKYVYTYVCELGEGEIVKQIESIGRRRLDDQSINHVYVPSLVPVPE